MTRSKARVTQIDNLSPGYRMTELGPLPEEWRVVRLGEVVSLRRGTVDPAKAGYRRYVGLEHIQPGNVRLTSWGDPGSVKSAKAVFKPGDILFAKLRPYLDKAAIAESEGICSTDILVLTPGEHIDNWYFAFLAHHPFVLNHAISTTTGVNHPRTSWRALSVGLIPLPPISEQRAIAHVLRTVQQAKEATERVIAAARELKKSLMRHLFTYGPVPLDQADQVPLKETEIGPVPENWELVKLGELCRIVRGGSPRPKSDPRYFSKRPTGIHWIKISDLTKYKRGLYITATDEYLTEEGKRKSRFLRRGTFVVTNSGTVGIPAFLRIDGCIHDGYLAFLDIETSRLHEFYLYYWIENIKTYLEKIAPRGTQANLNTTIAKNLSIFLPPISEQREIAHILQTVDRKIEAEEARKEALEVLFKTLLHHLMTAKIRLPKDYIEQFKARESVEDEQE